MSIRRFLQIALLLLLSQSLVAAEVAAPVEHRRGVEQTFLTFPEWYLVHSPAEYAAYVKTHSPDSFPFWGHIRQFWSGYRAVWEATRQAGYPFNGGYHVMIMVIGSSTTVEYALRSAYETLIGRLSALTRTHGMTAEDRLAARVAQDYVDFIRVHPWYEFDFVTPLQEVWADTGLGGHDLLRKWERKYALTTEYGAKALYGWLIRKATRAAYEEPLPTTAVLIDRLPAAGTELPSGVSMLERLPDGSVLLLLPRYEAFKIRAAELAAHGLQFREIAGNRSLILVSLLEPVAWRSPFGSELFSQAILTRPGVKRAVLEVPVAELADLLRLPDAQGAHLEHVYDY